jgi:small ligand-binding sensory domain FIST
MRWASALSQRADARQALAEVSESVLAELGGQPDLALLFVSHTHAPAFDAIGGWAQSLLAPRHLLGCSGSGVIGSGREVERREAISVVAARLPGVQLFPFHMEEAPRSADAALWAELTGLKAQEARGFLLWGDPFSVDAEPMLRRFDQAYPNVPKLGALVSGAQAPGESVLFLDGRVLRGGALGLGFSGRVDIHTAVAQGCRPIGEPMIVTRCRDSVVYELNVGRPVEALQKLFERLDPRDQELCRHSLFLGIEMSAGAHRYGQGDFLIRTLGGLEPKGGAMAVQANVENYQVVQFHLRDARTSAQDLEQHLAVLQRALGTRRARGALLFSCVGRGQELYGQPNHDTDLFCRHFGALPLGGMFAGGEIGPVGDRTFVHGYTSVFGVFSEPAPAN